MGQLNRKLRREWSDLDLPLRYSKMLSTEKSLFSPWPAVSSLSLSAWPTPAGGDNSDKHRGQALNNQINQANTKKPWKSNFAPNFTSSTDVSPTYNSKIQNTSNFSFENVTCRDLQIDNIDQLAAKLLNLSDEPTVEVVAAPSSASDVVRPISTPSPNTTESDIHLPIPASSSNARSTPDLLSSDKSDEDDQGGLNARFKTEICRNFKEKGHCLYGDLCQFAHGKDEMRNVGQHSKYKTKRCQKYWIAGYCAYGPRCNFLHYEEKDQIQPKHGGNSTSRARDSSGSGGSGEMSVESSCTTPSLSPPHIKYKLPSTPVPLEVLYRPSHGSGRLAAITRDGEFHWIDIRTQKYV